MTEPIVIRPGTPADVETAAEIAVAAWVPVFVEFRRRLGDDIYLALYEGWEESKRNQVRQAFAGHPDCLLVTEVAGRVVGFITFFVVDPARGLGEIGNNAVHPDFQGRGIGRRQYDRVFEELRARGARIVQVTTGLDEAHAPARRAYEAAGFDRELPKVTYFRTL